MIFIKPRNMILGINRALVILKTSNIPTSNNKHQSVMVFGESVDYTHRAQNVVEFEIKSNSQNDVYFLKFLIILFRKCVVLV